MKRTFKGFLSFLLVFAMLAAFLPAGTILAAEPAADPVVQDDSLTQDDYDRVDAVFDLISQMEEAPAKKNSPQSELTDEAVAIVTTSDSYVEGSLVRNGDSFTWETDTGIRCGYSPRMRKINSEMEAPAEPQADGIYNEPVATKGGWPGGNQVYLIGPYYGYDSDFTDQYKNEAAAIATAIGDTDGYTLYSGKAATVEKVAEAVSNGAVVIFDSHGNTDYESDYDYVTGATSSFLCLKSTTGLTTEDYDDGAIYDATGIWINGATIANHMTSNSPNGLLWMAICLGMATDTFSTPLRAMGVEVVYGYSQSVTFAGDYLYEETFWDEMIGGATVASAVATMKSTWGNWDWSTKIATYYGYSDGYSTISAARADYSAFPVVVSGEDAHPGQRNRNTFYGADSLQTVKSTYTLYSQYNVAAQVNNTAWGSASVSGNTITAIPATGYYAQGYTVASGNATVSQNGNTFSVNAQSDCVVQINFAPKTAISVNFSGASVAAQSGYAGDSMTLPTAAAPEGYTFLGWMDAPLSQNTTEKPTYYTGSFVPTENTTLYALYSFVEAADDGGTGEYVKVTSTPADWSGEYLIVYEDGGLILDGSLNAMDASGNYKSVTITNHTISADDGDPYKFTIAQYNGSYSIQAASGVYIGCSSNTNALQTSSNALQNSLSLDASGNANIIGFGGAYLRYNTSATRFRYYKSSSYSNQKPVALYLKNGSNGTTWFTGAAVVCEHPNPQTVSAVAPSCTEGGYTQGVFCPDCAAYISGHEAVAALGHSYTTQVIAPTATTQGYTIYTCSVCSDSYTGNYVEALGQIYNVSFVVPDGVADISDMECGKAGITLPVAAAPAGEYAYEFLGWTIGQVDNVTARPVIYSGTFTATQDTTLYALYSYAVGGSGATEFVLTDLAQITPEDLVVITMDYQGTVYAMNNINGTSDGPDGIIVEVTTADGVSKLTQDPDEDLLWNIGGTAGAYTIYPAGQTDVWLYCISSNNGVRVGTGTEKTFDIQSNYLHNIGQNRYIGVYRINPDWRCYTSVHANIADQTLGFYVKTESGTTYYTTEFAPACDHQYGYALANGVHTLTCGTCGDVITMESTDSKKFAINSAAPLLADDIVMKYNTTIPAGFENPYMVFDFNGESFTVTDYEIDETNGRYIYKFPGINPQKMGDNICATLYASVDGVPVSVQIASYSMVKNCDNQLKKSSLDAETRTLLSDVLIYGQKAQISTNYKTDVLVTSLLSAASTLTPSTFPEALDSSLDLQKRTGTKDDRVQFTAVTLALGSKMAVRVAVTCTDTSLFTYKVTISGREYTYTGDDLVPVSDGSDGKYYLYFDQMKAREFGELMTFTCWEGDTQVSYTIEYSVYTFIYRNYNKSSLDEATKDLLKAIYNYGESTK